MHRLASLAVISAALCVMAAPASATIVTYYGNDNGAIAGGPRPNADAALSSFNAAAGVGGTINFEGVANAQNPSNVTVASGVRLTVAGNANGGVRNTAAVTPLGFNTSGTGNKWLQMYPAGNSGGSTAVFSFSTSIDAFGAFFSDTEVGFPGNITITFNDGTAQSLGATKGANGGGVLFFGFTDIGKSFDTVTISTGSTNSLRDIFGIDDVRYAEVPAVPEPTTLALMALGLAGLALTRRRA